MKKIFDIILQIIWIILQLPQIIIALFMMPFLGKMSLIRRENYCWVFKCEKMAGGIPCLHLHPDGAPAAVRRFRLLPAAHGAHRGRHV